MVRTAQPEVTSTERAPAPELSATERAFLDRPAEPEGWEQRVEAAARAIWECHPGAIPWDKLSPRTPTRTEYRRLAAAALSADSLQPSPDGREPDSACARGEHDWTHRGTPGDEWRECFLCGTQR